MKCIGLFSLACVACHYTLCTRDLTMCESHCDEIVRRARDWDLRHRCSARVWGVSEVIHPPTCTARIYDAGPKRWRESGKTVVSS